jgi:NAD+ diphosphatase
MISSSVGRYSTLAGFVGVGESVEQTVIRETYEESGVEVDPTSLVYVASQPYPFPSSLMLGRALRIELILFCSYKK